MLFVGCPKLAKYTWGTTGLELCNSRKGFQIIKLYFIFSQYDYKDLLLKAVSFKLKATKIYL